MRDFAFVDLLSGKRQSHCRRCQATYRRQHYLANREEYIEREAARIKTRRERNRVRICDYLGSHPCVGCRETDLLVLQFDHRDPAKKVLEVGILASSRSWTKILTEIKKCDVRCANCHRLRTARQFNWTKLGAAVTSKADAAPRAPGAKAVPEELRVCTGCEQEKPLTEFAFRDKARGRLRRRCKDCMRKYAHAHYRLHRDKYASGGWDRNRQGRATMRRYVHQYLGAHPCVDCGETNIVVLDFDHRDGSEKIETIAWLLARGRTAELLSEIAKCEVRCANCHQRRTAAQFGWTKAKRAAGTISEPAGVL